MPKNFWIIPLVAACLLWGFAPDSAAADRDKLAIKAGRIITLAGDDLENGTILIAHGKIEAVGKDLEIPYDYWLVDLPDKVIFPGMVQAITSRGMDRSNESLPVTPFLNVFDAIDPSSTSFEEALRNGHTSIHVAQGSNTVIGGLSRVVRPIGMDVHEMTVAADAGIVVSFAPKSGFDHMVQMATLRETFRELDDYLNKTGEALYEKKLKDEDKEIDVGPDEAARLGREMIKDEDLDFKHLNLFRLITGRLKAFLYCSSPLDVVHALDMAKKEGFFENSVLVLGNACYKALDLIKASGLPVILQSNMVFVKKDPLTGEEEDIFVPALFHDAGVKFSVTADSRRSFGARYLWYQAARLIRNGMPRADALTAITTTPASALGLGERLGAIQPGFDANLLVLNGDPLDAETWVEKVFIDGCMVYEREKDYRLKDLIEGEEIVVEEATAADADPASPTEEKNDGKSETDTDKSPDPKQNKADAKQGTDSDSKE